VDKVASASSIFPYLLQVMYGDQCERWSTEIRLHVWRSWSFIFEWGQLLKCNKLFVENSSERRSKPEHHFGLCSKIPGRRHTATVETWKKVYSSNTGNIVTAAISAAAQRSPKTSTSRLSARIGVSRTSVRRILNKEFVSGPTKSRSCKNLKMLILRRDSSFLSG
jgi:hypothetical protein